ncbi:MAG: hypothetical protein CFE23_16200 [Flavobacterium sp. BFFFF1]|nr:MAG: hypothetical protein CFE23_16200 [Flavobacterium sp. BFFFF1]
MCGFLDGGSVTLVSAIHLKEHEYHTFNSERSGLFLRRFLLRRNDNPVPSAFGNNMSAYQHANDKIILQRACLDIVIPTKEESSHASSPG